MSDLASRLARLYSGAVFDVMKTKGLPDTVLPADIVPLDDSKPMAGPVFTMRGRPVTDASAHETLLGWTDFLSKAPAGHVAVCQAQDDRRALMGELSAECLKRRGGLGFLTDGGSRDCGQIRAIGFPVFCRFRTPRDVTGDWMPEAFDVPIVIGGVPIRPGDYLLADFDGAIVVPKDQAADIVSEVEAVAATENDMRAAILAGMDPKAAYLRFGKF